MKIQYLKNSEIDIALWDDCVKQSLQSLPYSFSFYLKIVAPGFSGIILNDYDAVLPLPIKSKFGVEYVFRPLLCQQLGIVSKKKLGAGVIAKMVNAVPAKIKYIDYCVSNKLSDKGSFIPRDNYIIHLNQPYSKLLANYKYNTRRQVKIVLKKEPKIIQNVDVSSIIKLMQQTFDSNNSVLTNKDYVILKELLETLSAQKIGYSLGALNNENKLCAVIFYIITNKRIINLINSSTTFAKKNGLMTVIIDHIIKNNSNKNYTFDFEGSNIPSVARFFRSFGSEKTVYYNWRWNRLPFPFKYLKP